MRGLTWPGQTQEEQNQNRTAEFCLPIRLTHKPGDSREVSASDATVLAGFSEEISDKNSSLGDNLIGRKNFAIDTLI